MIDKKISVSEQVADLSTEAQVIFTWSIPHADDFGILPSSLKTLKATVVPMKEYGLAEFTKYVLEIIKKDLWREFEYNGEKFIKIVKFKEHQTLKQDRQPQTILKFELDKEIKKSWKTGFAILERLGFQLEGNGIHLGSERKRSEVNRNEEEDNNSSGELTPKEEAQQFFDYVIAISSKQEPAERPEWVINYLNELVEKGIQKQKLWVEVVKFTCYWTEKTPSGKKQLWETKKTFEVKRRLATWLSRVGISAPAKKVKGIIE